MRKLKLKNWAVWMVCGVPIAGANATQALSEGRQVLPRTLVPARYELTLVPDAQALTFKGTEKLLVTHRRAGARVLIERAHKPPMQMR